MRFSTRAVHGAGTFEDGVGASVRPIYQSSTFRWESLEREPPFMYARYGNPNRAELEATLAALEGAEYGACFSSGMAALAAAMSLAQAGDHVVLADAIYGGTAALAAKLLPRHGIEVSSFDSLKPESLRAAARPNTKLVFYESPTNPTVEVVDIAAVAAVAKQLGILTVFDNTFATPYLTRPLSLGADVVVHSTTKYLGGHSDVTGGAALTNDAAIHAHLLEQLKLGGAVPEPFASWLTLRGVKTLPARMRVHCDNAARVAEHLAAHPKVRRVCYPGLAEPDVRALAARQMEGRFGGIVAFELEGGRDAAFQFAERTRVFHIAASLGGVESLLSYPPLFSHAGLTEEERQARGITPGLLRASVGLEDIDDLVEDLDRALA
ncbi:MAG: aminotransferase class I/II-fold pyridoxal phosphate-dependent enzyme [Fimbriimonadaceae bacterium]|nr:aminotransferase class I/II-fold pyridoxal phosphate-dependent enzyme [Fimbriimonadaceae bacterium]